MKKNIHIAHLSLGSNLGNKALMLQKAVYLLEDRLGSITAISPVYKTAAWGFDSEDFLNCCLSIEVSITPLKVLDTTHIAHLSLGSNLGNKALMLQKAVYLLEDRLGSITAFIKTKIPILKFFCYFVFS